MKQQLLYLTLLAALVCGGCSAKPPVAPSFLPEGAGAPVFKTDLAPSPISYKEAQLWEHVPSGYYVPLALMRDAAEAWAIERRATNDALPGVVQQLVLNDLTCYRVLIGPFQNKKAAQKQASEFEKKELVDVKPVVEYLKR